MNYNRWIVLFLVFGLLTNSFNSLFSQNSSQFSITDIINEDGSLKKNLKKTGSIDVSNYNVTTGPDGAPRFVQKSSSSNPNDAWCRFGAFCGTNRNIEALAIDQQGNLYAGGNFFTADDNSIGPVIVWDGSSWSDVGSLGGIVYSLEIGPDGDLYAVRYFSS